MPLKLGKTPAAPKPKDFKLASFFDHEKALALATPKIPFGFGRSLPWKMLGNGPDDSVFQGFEGAGDCVEAGQGEAVRIFNHERGGHDVPISGKQSISDYSKLTGYVLGDDSTDNGTDMGDAAEFWRKTGMLDANGDRHKILAWARGEPGNFDQLLAACFSFSVVGVGIIFTAAQDEQFVPGTDIVWDYVPGSPELGGHLIPGVGTVTADQLAAISWAEHVRLTRGLIENQCDEWIAYVSEEQVRSDGNVIHGLDVAALEALLKTL